MNPPGSSSRCSIQGGHIKHQHAPWDGRPDHAARRVRRVRGKVRHDRAEPRISGKVARRDPSIESKCQCGTGQKYEPLQYDRQDPPPAARYRRMNGELFRCRSELAKGVSVHSWTPTTAAAVCAPSPSAHHCDRFRPRTARLRHQSRHAPIARRIECCLGWLQFRHLERRRIRCRGPRYRARQNRAQRAPLPPRGLIACVPVPSTALRPDHLGTSSAKAMPPFLRPRCRVP